MIEHDIIEEIFACRIKLPWLALIVCVLSLPGLSDFFLLKTSNISTRNHVPGTRSGHTV